MADPQSLNKGIVCTIPVPISATGAWRFSEEISVYLRSCHVVVCERIRTTRRHIKYLFSQEEFDKLHFIEMDKHGSNEYKREVTDCLKKNQRIAIMSEAGMPCIADPGDLIVRLAHRQGVQVKPFAGPSSFLMALMASGLNGQAFTFHGYLPRNQDELKRKLQSIDKAVSRDRTSHIFMETPYRNQKLFEEILRSVSNHLALNISMEINGEDEFIKTKTISEWKKSSFSFNEKLPTVFILGHNN